ncbi:MAG TPA: CRISPR-associated endonuclease Cas1 [Sandaracinaceae bacterium LLY-WYZ-13_1]|nr:CRISPR-associated endonuclease Cas1 [Sandaracinaceae bacterium LLY-WYZ-13_1]
MGAERGESETPPPLETDALPPPKTLGRLPIASEAPELVPARMINEALYCARLMYLEWAQGEFVDNVYTVDGRVIHRRVDKKSGGLPETADDAEAPPFEARSVWLSSEKLGITAKIDYVESDDGAVVPVEHKRGKAPNLKQGAYLPERAQVCAHVLLLREHGFRCDRGEIWFAASRQRVPIEIDAALIDKTLRAVARARELCASGVIPEPFQDSPKCVGCSLSSVCLPDEVNLLRGLSGEPFLDSKPAEEEQLGFDFMDSFGPMEADPWQLQGDPDPEPAPSLRRLVPARDERIPLYVQSQGARISLDGDRLRVSAGVGVAGDARLPQTSHVVVYGNAQITSQALAALFDRNIPVFFFSHGGWFRGRTLAHGSKNVELRVQQYRAADDPEATVALARTFVTTKIRNQRTLLRRNGSGIGPVALGELESLAKKAERAEAVQSLLGLEGTAARTYFGGFTKMLKGEAKEIGAFDMNGRNRRPPRDPINALLSFAYALLVKDCALALSVAGLDPLLGYLHKPRYGRPALALDLMEEMRPLIADSTVITAVNNGEVRPSDFAVTVAGAGLKAAGRKRFIATYERRMDQLVSHPLFGYRISYRRLLEVQARLLGRTITGEIPAYPAFRTR